jgi:hypothetical protein
MRRAILALATLVCTSAVCAAEPMVTIRNNGPSDKRLNIIVLGDGYTEAEMIKYARDVDVLIDGLFRQQPYRRYASYFNVHRVDVISNESGADHPERSVQRDTALGAAYNCGGTQRLICINNAAVADVLSRSVPVPDRDLVIILVNDPEYGGSGGRYSVASTHELVVELMLHEAGHTVALLADEYDTGSSCEALEEPSQVNATRKDSRAVKWNYWVDERTEVPSLGQTPLTPGVYPGVFCRDGFRPTYDSKMRSLLRPFEQINTEQLIKRFYNFVSPIDEALPAESNVSVRRGDSAEFVVARPRPEGADLIVSWTLDGRAIGSDDRLSLRTANLALGRYQVELTVRDPVADVRNDPTHALTERVRWTLQITP